MSYVITYTCEWCGKKHSDPTQTIKGELGSNTDFIIDDLCYGCYKKLRRALKTQRDITSGKAALTSFAVFVALLVVGIITFICGLAVGSL